MKSTKMVAPAVLLLFVCSLTAIAQEQRWIGLTEAKQNAYLAERVSDGALIGTFDAVCSLLFSFDVVVIHTNDKDINETVLKSPFPSFYKPTVKQLLDTIALQTHSSWKYDSKTGYFVFGQPKAAKPYSIITSANWSATDRGVYVGYTPPTYPVGMDVYYFGEYTAGEPKQQSALEEKIRNSLGIRLAGKAKKEISISDMQKVSVDGTEALYFESATPRPGVVWRQWALVKNGQAFVIVSALRAVDKALLADVESMVKSFHVTP